MVTVVGFKEVETQEGKIFASIELQGEPRLEQSTTTGNFYLTANKTRVTTSFPIEVCNMLMGKKLPGTVEKVQVEPYEYVNKETGELLTLNHAYIYAPEQKSREEFEILEMDIPENVLV